VRRLREACGVALISELHPRVPAKQRATALPSHGGQKRTPRREKERRDGKEREREREREISISLTAPSLPPSLPSLRSPANSVSIVRSFAGKISQDRCCCLVQAAGAFTISRQGRGFDRSPVGENSSRSPRAFFTAPSRRAGAARDEMRDVSFSRNSRIAGATATTVRGCRIVIAATRSASRRRSP